MGPAGAAIDLEELVKDDLGGEDAINLEVEEEEAVLMLEEEELMDEVLVLLDEFFLLLPLIPDIKRSPLPLLSSPPLLRLFLFSLFLDTSLSSLPRNFSDEPGDLRAEGTGLKILIL